MSEGSFGDLAGESSLLQAVRAGDASAFWQLWEAHSGRLFAICLSRMHGNREDAQDALGDAMLRAFERMPCCAGRIVRLEQWLNRLTRNVCTDIHRRRIRGMQAEADLAIRGGETPEEGADPFHSAVSVVCQSDIPISALMERLPERLREVLVLRVLRKMSYDEIAARLHLTSVNARKRVQQARAALRAMVRNSQNENRASRE